MLNWKTFLERKGCEPKAIEDMEEKLGKDLDADEEKGEPISHKMKVFRKVKPEEEKG